MQAIMETIFSTAYLITVISLGCYIIRRSKDNRQYRLFGIMTLVLGCGDAFHLAPRVIALCTTGLENYTAALGIGKLITSITMTLFYVILYHIWKIRYEVTDKKILTVSVYVLAVIRIALCLLPQNKWLSADAPFEWGVYRNIPFVALGLIMIIIFFKISKNRNRVVRKPSVSEQLPLENTFSQAWLFQSLSRENAGLERQPTGLSNKSNDKTFRFLWLAILLSFAFYIPVVLFADSYPLVGMLMLPKTCAYVWIVWMGFKSKGNLTF